jgi:hypothetical protein
LPPAARGALQRLMPRRWWHAAAGQASAWLHVTRCACQRPDGAVGSQVAARSCCSSPRLVGSSAACPPRPGACSAGSGRVGGAAGSRSGRRAALAPPSRPAGEPVVVHAAGLECSTGPSVESSRNRAVIWAGVALGTGIGSGICVPFPGRTDPRSHVGLRRHRSTLADCSAARIGGAGVGEQCRRAHGRSVVRHHLAVDCLVAKPGDGAAARRCLRQDRGPSCSTGRRFGLDNNRSFVRLARLSCLPALPLRSVGHVG